MNILKLVERKFFTQNVLINMNSILKIQGVIKRYGEWIVIPTTVDATSIWSNKYNRWGSNFQVSTLWLSACRAQSEVVFTVFVRHHEFRTTHFVLSCKMCQRSLWNVKSMYGDNVSSLKTVYKWYERFKSENESIADDSLSGCFLTS